MEHTTKHYTGLCVPFFSTITDRIVVCPILTALWYALNARIQPQVVTLAGRLFVGAATLAVEWVQPPAGDSLQE